MAKEKYGLTCDYKFAVGIYNPYKGTMKWVDSVDHGTKTATWKKGAKALPMTKEAAIMLQVGLLCNGTTALVIEMPDYMFDGAINVEELYEPDTTD